jgi:hypothetical protein
MEASCSHGLDGAFGARRWVRPDSTLPYSADCGQSLCRKARGEQHCDQLNFSAVVVVKATSSRTVERQESMNIIACHNRGADECPVARIRRIESLNVLGISVRNQPRAVTVYELKDCATSVRMLTEVASRTLGPPAWILQMKFLGGPGTYSKKQARSRGASFARSAKSTAIWVWRT